MMWIPILVCTHLFCSGEPIKGKPVATYEECRQVLSLSLVLYGDPAFTSRYVVTKCERID